MKCKLGFRSHCKYQHNEIECYASFDCPNKYPKGLKGKNFKETYKWVLKMSTLCKLSGEWDGKGEWDGWDIQRVKEIIKEQGWQ